MFGIATVAFFILIGVTAGPPKTEQQASNAPATENAAEPKPEAAAEAPAQPVAQENQNVEQTALLDQSNSNQNKTVYTHFGNAFDVYDEHENLVGSIMESYTDECGSDCNVDVLFLKTGSTDKLSAAPVPKLGADSLGLDFFEKDKALYRSTFVWNPSEGHFGCHYIKIDKINYVDNQFEVKEDFITDKKYAFDAGDAQGQCGLFPGIEKILLDHDSNAQVNPPTLTPTVTNAPSCESGYYKNVDGNCIKSPGSNSNGASAKCRDGSYSYSQHRQGTCSHHGGVAQWY